MIEAIVTGASGFIGRALVKRLTGDGIEVMALAGEDGDVAHADTWSALPPAPAVIHLAGRSYVPDSWKQGPEFVQTNVLGTEQALAYCRRHGARLVYVSAYVYGIPGTLPIAETHPVHPNNPYALSKLLAEQLCEFASGFQGVPATVLRIFNAYGPHQREEFLIPEIIRQVAAGKAVRVLDLKPRRDYIYIEDVVDAIVRSLTIKQGFNRINIGSGVSYSVREIIDIIQQAAGTCLPVMSADAERPQEIPDVKADIGLARAVLNWAPQWSFDNGIRHMLSLELQTTVGDSRPLEAPL